MKTYCSFNADHRYETNSQEEPGVKVEKGEVTSDVPPCPSSTHKPPGSLNASHILSLVWQMAEAAGPCGGGHQPPGFKASEKKAPPPLSALRADGLLGRKILPGSPMCLPNSTTLPLRSGVSLSCGQAFWFLMGVLRTPTHSHILPAASLFRTGPHTATGSTR